MATKKNPKLISPLGDTAEVVLKEVPERDEEAIAARKERGAKRENHSAVMDKAAKDSMAEAAKVRGRRS